ncbi:hypothetical protein [Tuwongella immobilis]|uniref:hypothetical protein n=1 Tax=Tuwongella immobilis TaxID=692036 RepID=UPI001E536DBB|nr:hypothetical protein [Tuwongella immobilis]
MYSGRHRFLGGGGAGELDHSFGGGGGGATLNVSAVYPFEACAAFAAEWLARVAAGDFRGAEQLINANDAGCYPADCFPTPDEFPYIAPDRAVSWRLDIMGVSERGLNLEFEVPSGDRGVRAMVARFRLQRVGEALQVRFGGVAPA